MSVLDAPLTKTAARLIKQFGRDVVLSKITQSAYNPIVGRVDLSAQDYTVRGLIEEFSYKEKQSSLIQEGDIKLHIAASGLGTIPTQKDRVAVDSALYEVVRVESVISGASTALYTVQLRSRGTVKASKNDQPFLWGVT